MINSKSNISRTNNSNIIIGSVCLVLRNRAVSAGRRGYLACRRPSRSRLFRLQSHCRCIRTQCTGCTTRTKLCNNNSNNKSLRQRPGRPTARSSSAIRFSRIWLLPTTPNSNIITIRQVVRQRLPLRRRQLLQPQLLWVVQSDMDTDMDMQRERRRPRQQRRRQRRRLQLQQGVHRRHLLVAVEAREIITKQMQRL